MSAITFGELRKLVFLKCRLKSKNGLINDALQNEDVDEQILQGMWAVTRQTQQPEVWGELTWPVSTPATQEVNLPDDCWRVLRVYLNCKQIDPTTILDLSGARTLVRDASWKVYLADAPTALAQGDFVANSSLNGVNFMYYMRKQTPKILGIVPAVNSAIPVTIDYIQGPVIPADDNTALNYPLDLKERIVEEASWRVMEILQKDDRADRMRARVESRKEEDIDSVQNSQDEYIHNIQPMPYRDQFRL